MDASVVPSDTRAMQPSLALVVVLAAATACRNLDELAAENARAAGAAPSTKLDRSVPLELSGDWVHPASGIAFPAKAAGFVRVMPMRYDAEGNDVGIGYRRIWADESLLFRAEVTIYVFPTQRQIDGSVVPFDGQFEAEAVEVRRSWRNAQEVRRADSEGLDSGVAVHVRSAEFECIASRQGGNLPMTTILTAYLRDQWHVTYRITIPPPRRDACLAATEQLLSELRLPPTGLPPAVR